MPDNSELLIDDVLVGKLGMPDTVLGMAVDVVWLDSKGVGADPDANSSYSVLGWSGMVVSEDSHRVGAVNRGTRNEP